MKPSPVFQIFTGQLKVLDCNAVAVCVGCGARIVSRQPIDVMRAAEKHRWQANYCRRCQTVIPLGGEPS